MSEPTGNELVDEFLEELDARIGGARGTPPESATRLAAMRPFLRMCAIGDPDFCAEFIRDYFEEREDT